MFLRIVMRLAVMLFLLGSAHLIASLVKRFIPEGRIKDSLYRRRQVGQPARPKDDADIQR